MNKIYKILGKRGRIMIPFEIRQELGFQYNDVIGFERSGDSVIVKCEKICDDCAAVTKPDKSDRAVTLLELLDDLTPAELRAALIHLSVKWAEVTAKGGDGA